MIVVAGEALVDLIPAAAGSLGVHPGGGPFNSARWLGWLGTEVAFLGAMSSDAFGQQLRAELSAAGVGLELLVDSEHPTTLALAQLGPSGSASYSFYTDGTSVCDLTVERAVHGVHSYPTDVLLAGGISLVLEPVGAALEVAVAAARSSGALVVIDPNVRPGLISDRARYMSRLDRLLAHSHVLKCSVEDLAWLMPDIDPAGAAARILDGPGPAAVVVTDGGAGVTVVTASGVAAVPVLPVDVVDTIGAGDAFNAGFLADWLRSGRRVSDLSDLVAVREAACFGAAVAGVACQQRGAAPPHDPVSQPLLRNPGVAQR